jgi:EmrB/QacA subfamily drug resistance transporter
MSHPASPADDRIPAEVYHRRWLILAVLCTSLLVVVLANTSMNVALPSMARELQLDTSGQQWVVDAYALVFAGLLFTAGTLGDRFGRKGFLQVGLLLFAAGSLYATLFADSAGEVIGARAVMGVGGALVMPTTLSILVNAFPDRERAKAISIWAGVAGMGGALGLLIGGWLAEHYWWGSAFAVNLPVVAISLAAGALILPRSKDSSAPRIDIGGSLLSIAGLGTLVFALIEAPHWGWLSATTAATLTLAVALLASFVAWEKRAQQPMLDMNLFRVRRFGVGALGMTMVFIVLFGFFFITVQYFQLVAGYGPFEAGLRMVPFIPVMVVMALASPILVRRFGTRLVLTVGMLFTATGVLVLSRLGSTSPYTDVLVGIIVMTFGMGITMSPMTDMMMSSVPRSHAGVGSAMNDTTRELGTTMGVAILGSLLSSAYSGGLPATVDAMDAPTQEMVRGSLGGALFVSEQLGGEQGAVLAASARAAWMDGVKLAFEVGAGILVAAAMIVFFFLEHRRGAVDLAGDLGGDLTGDVESLDEPAVGHNRERSDSPASDDGRERAGELVGS